MRERGEQGAKQLMTAVVSGNGSGANEQKICKNFLTGGKLSHDNQKKPKKTGS